jgi:hypothetical protein
MVGQLLCHHLCHHLRCLEGDTDEDDDEAEMDSISLDKGVWPRIDSSVNIDMY